MVRPIILCILDGWGVGQKNKFNPIEVANLPTYRFLLENFQHSKLCASEKYVGLPDKQMGNSEVGHMTIGSGRVIMQDLVKISHALNGDIGKIKILQNSGTNNVCHIVSLLSDGGVHSHINHIIALAGYYVTRGIVVNFHIITDGRDTLPKTAKAFVQQIIDFCKNNPKAQIATISGRYYAMDRDKRYERTQLAYQSIVLAQNKTFDHSTILETIEESYKLGVTDEFIIPQSASNYYGMQDGDMVFFANFRSDRMRQIVAAIVMEKFEEFDTKKISLSAVLTITHYAEMFNDFVKVVFPPEKFTNTLSDILASNNLSQLRIAETEKYAHVTFFFDCGNEQTNANETRILIPSPKVSTYDLAPEMSAHQLTEKIIAEYQNKSYDFCLVNYANADMVGHTGKFDAAVKAVECLDKCLKELYQLIIKINGILLITADHGNIEEMYDSVGDSIYTTHTINPVPFIVVDPHLKNAKVADGGLADIAPTILDLFALTKPSEMTGHNLVRKEW